LAHSDSQRAAAEILTFDALVQEAQKVISSELGSDAHEFFTSLLDQMAGAQNCTWGDVIRTLDGHLGIAADAREYSEVTGTIFTRPLRALVRPAVLAMASDIQRRVTRLVDEPKSHLPGAKQTLLSIRERAQAIEPEIGRALTGAREKRLSLLESARLKADAGGTRLGSKNTEPLLQYFLRARDECVLCISTGLVRGLLAELSVVMEQLIQLGRELEQLGAALAKPKDDNVLLPGDSSFNVRPLVADGWRKRRAELVGLIQQRIKSEFADPSGGLHEILGRGRSQELCKRLRDTARQVVLEAVQSIDLMGYLLGSPESDKTSGRLQSAMETAKPRFLASGGIQHFIAVLPSGPDTQRHTEEIRHALDPDASVLVCPNNELTMCYEGAGISLAHLAVDLIQGRRDYVELAERVHTRHDVEWSPLTALRSVAASSDSGAVQADTDPAEPTEASWTLESQGSTIPEPSANVS
jgi:hypothetical protein